jgi:hypothetical protein
MHNQRDDARNTIVPGWTLIRRDGPSGDGHAACFYRRDSVFCFVIEKWYGPFTDDDRTALDDAYWAQEYASGLFGFLQDAEREAARVLGLGSGG